MSDVNREGRGRKGGGLLTRKTRATFGWSPASDPQAAPDPRRPHSLANCIEVPGLGSTTKRKVNQKRFYFCFIRANYRYNKHEEQDSITPGGLDASLTRSDSRTMCCCCCCCCSKTKSANSIGHTPKHRRRSGKLPLYHHPHERSGLVPLKGRLARIATGLGKPATVRRYSTNRPRTCFGRVNKEHKERASVEHEQEVEPILTV